MTYSAYPVPKFKVGDPVRKILGYRFPGEIRAILFTKKGELRYVVEAVDPNFSGMLHIFNEEQLSYRERADEPHHLLRHRNDEQDGFQGIV